MDSEKEMNLDIKGKKVSGRNTDPPENAVPAESAEIDTAATHDQGESLEGTLKKQEEEDFKTVLAEKEDRYLRLAAEFDNYKKRMARQFENTAISTREETLSPILEIIDNIERALEAARQATDLESLKKGMELIYQQLGRYLQKSGVEKIPAVGQPFDPNLHEAMMQTDSDQYDEGIVVQELIPGYRLNGRVLRHARVAVSRGKGESVTDSGTSTPTE